MQGFVAGHGVAYAFISKEHGALWAAVDWTSEEETPVERYGAIAMNHIELSAYNAGWSWSEGTGGASTDVERDNQVFTGLANTSSYEAGKKLSACGLWSGSGF